MQTGIGETIDTASSEITDMASSAYDSVKDLFGFGDTPKPVAPTPTPVPLKKIVESDFTMSPTIEKVLMDPFDAIGLKTLSATDLGIDKVVDYLSSVIPTDLLSAVKSAPGLAETLLNKAKSLESFVGDLSRKLPQNCSIGSLLRKSSIMDIYENIDEFKSTCSQLAVKVERMPESFTSDSLRFMSNMRQAFDTTKYTKMFGNMANIDSITGTKSYRHTPIGITGVTLANVNLTATGKSTAVGMFVSAGVTDNKAAVSVIRKTLPTEFASLCAGTKLLGLNRSTTLLDAMDIYRGSTLKIITEAIYNHHHVGKVIGADITTLSNITAAYGSGVINNFYANSTDTSLLAVCMFLKEYGLTTLKVINTSINDNGETLTVANFTAAASWLTTFQSPTVVTLLNVIKDIGVNEYLTQHPSTPYGDVLAMVVATGIDYVIAVFNVLLLLPLDSVVSIITDIGQLPLGVIDNIILTGSADHNVPAALLGLIETIPTDKYLQYMSMVSQYGAQLVDAVIVGINASGLNNFITFVSNVEKIGVESTKTNLKTFISLSPESVVTIATHISYNNPLLQLQKIHPSGPFLHYSVKKSCEICAKAGKALMVESLVVGYAGKILDNERYQYVMDILTYYVPDDDDTVIGQDLAAKHFVTALFSICPTWDIVKGNNASIANMVPYIRANSAALNLLLHDDRTCIAAAIQKDNMYKL